jgi:hypothetical protein
MIKDFFVSFRDNFRDKVKNPFLGTYLLVWLIRNWDLIFTLFNFNEGTTLENKISIITAYLKDNPFFGGLVTNILYTFLFLVLTYTLLNTSRAIVNLFDRQLKPWVYKLTDKSSIVLKEDFEALRNERDNLLVRINNERDEKAKVESLLNKLQAEVLIQNKDRVLQNEKAPKKIKSVTQKMFDSLNSRKLTEDFLFVVRKIKKGEGFNSSEKMIDPFIDLGIIKHQSTDGFGAKKFSVTEEGEQLFKLIRENKII